MDAQWYGSIAGIVAGTLIIVEVLKRAIGNIAVLKGVPTWIYSVIVAVSLTYASRAAGYLSDQGSTLDVLMSALMLAASASGFWTWLRQPTDPIQDSDALTQRQARRMLPVVLLAVALSGTLACGGNLAPSLIAGGETTQTALASAQQQVETYCGTRDVSETCKVIYGRFGDAWDAQIAYWRSLSAEQPRHGGLIEAVGRLVTELGSLPTDLRASVEADLRRVTDAAFRGARR